MIVYLAEIGSRPYVIDGDILGRRKWKESDNSANRGGANAYLRSRRYLWE